MENFVVSARKYRPATFDTVVGQKHVTETLKNAIARGQVAHAYLFTGPRGVGKTTCARIFAKAINCLQPAAGNEACGNCESCKSFDDGRSFNIHELDAASNNSVDDIRALNDKVRIAPQIGRYSVYIIDEVHMLSTGAFNAFLKTLEEPPPYAVFILATTEKHKILPTILSRCQGYDFNRIRVEDMVEYMASIAAREAVTYDDESLHIIAQKADGGMRDALSTFDRVVSFCGTDLKYEQVAESIGSLDFNTYFTATDHALAEDYPSLLTLLDRIMGKGFDPGHFIAGLGEHFRNLLVAKDPKTASLLEVTGSLAQRYAAQAAAADTEFLFNAINLITKADSTYKGATNRRLHTEMALIKLCSLKKKDSISENYPLPQIIVNRTGEPAAKSDSAADTEGSGGIAASAAAGPEKPLSGQAAPENQKAEKPLAARMEPVRPENAPAVADEQESTENEEPQASPTPEKAIGVPEREDRGETEPDEPKENAQEPPKGETGKPQETAQELQVEADDRQQKATRERQDEIGAGEPETGLEPHADETVAKQETMPEPPTRAKQRLATSISISSATIPENPGPEEAEKLHSKAEELTVEEIERRLTENYERLVGVWKERNRPRIATALTVKTLKDDRITIMVPDRILADEIEQNKWQIEEDIVKLMGCRAIIDVEVKHVDTVKLPVSTEKKLQFLVDKNEKILKLRDELDLTI